MRPMLCPLQDKKKPPITFADVKLPCLGSFKLDGIRGVCSRSKLYSRQLKPIPNLFISKIFAEPEFEGIDGELIVGLPNADDTYHVTESAVMTKLGEPDVKYYVFDRWDLDDQPFTIRLKYLMRMAVLQDHPNVTILNQELLTTTAQVEAFYHKALALKYEGAIFKPLYGLYKFGRCTLNEGWSMKFKPKESSEAVIEDCYEGMKNANEAVVSPTGFAHRSTHKENLIPKGVLGGYNARDLKTGVRFKLGGGSMFTDKHRKEAWERHLQGEEVGRIVRYTYSIIGVKDKPRQPQADGYRNMEIDG